MAVGAASLFKLGGCYTWPFCCPKGDVIHLGKGVADTRKKKAEKKIEKNRGKQSRNREKEGERERTADFCGSPFFSLPF